MFKRHPVLSFILVLVLLALIAAFAILKWPGPQLAGEFNKLIAQVGKPAAATATPTSNAPFVSEPPVVKPNQAQPDTGATATPSAPAAVANNPVAPVTVNPDDPSSWPQAYKDLCAVAQGNAILQVGTMQFHCRLLIPASPVISSAQTNTSVDLSGLSQLAQNPYMKAYQNGLGYTVPSNLQVPSNLLPGFIPVPSLVMGPTFKFPANAAVPNFEMKVPAAPADVTPWSCFPQDYSNGDAFNSGCKALQEAGKLPWDKPEAGFNDKNNWSCEGPDGWCSDDIQSNNWRMYTAYRLCHPAVGCLQDPNGGAVMLLVINLHDSDEVWNVRNSSAIFADSAAVMYGPMWDLSGKSYNLGGAAGDLRNHGLFNLAYPQKNPTDNKYEGQCGSSGLCKTVTYVVVVRVWDTPENGINYSHFVLLDWGQWVRP